MTADSTAEGETMETYQEALETWGEEAQIVMGIEECNELSLALAHLYRGRATDAEVVEELADVEIMCEQLSLVFGREAVAREKVRKLDRLRNRLEVC